MWDLYNCVHCGREHWGGGNCDGSGVTEDDKRVEALFKAEYQAAEDVRELERREVWIGRQQSHESGEEELRDAAYRRREAVV